MFLVGGLFWLVLIVAFAAFCIHAFRAATGLDGAKAMRDFYWTLLLIVVWIAVAASFFLMTALAFWPVLEALIGRESRGGALGPAIAVTLLFVCVAASPFVATKATSFLGRLRRRQQ